MWAGILASTIFQGALHEIALVLHRFLDSAVTFLGDKEMKSQSEAKFSFWKDTAHIFKDAGPSTLRGRH